MAKLQRNIAGFLPPFLLTEIAERNQDNIYVLETLVTTAKLFNASSARKGQLFRFINAGTSARQVYDAMNKYSRPGKKARFEGDPAGTDKAINDAYDFSGNMREFLMTVHGRNGIDANGMVMKLICHYGSKYCNAYWDGEQMTFGDGDQDIFNTFLILDVVCHEMEHGVTEYAAGTRYYGQSGALNEHFSDVRGALVTQYVNNQTADQAEWLVGKGIFMPKINPGTRKIPGRQALGASLRDMLEPGTGYSHPSMGKDPQPDHMDRYWKGSGDNGGVHYNSGIPNRAFCLFALAVGGYAWEKPGKIWYASRVDAGSNPSFAQFANCTMKACQAMYPDEVEKLRKAWADVGIVPSATEKDTLSEPEPTIIEDVDSEEDAA